MMGAAAKPPARGAGLDAPAAGDAQFLRVERLTKRFGEVAAVDDVSISIRKGEIFALLGSSGCGKSTLLRMLAGFERPSAGGIFLEGEEISGLRPFERPINMMFQSYALFPHLSVWENIAFGLKRHGQAREKVEAQVERMLGLVQLKPYAQRKPHQLSGGQQQRVAIARALVQEPEIILADEPIASLDPRNTRIVMDALLRINKHFGITVLCNLHSLDLARSYCDRLIGMAAGRIVFDGAPAALTDHIARELYDLEANEVMGEGAAEAPDNSADPALGKAAAA